MKRPRPPRELAARALCRLAGNPEDTKFEGRPMWESYLPEADAMIEAVGALPALPTDVRLALCRFAAQQGVGVEEAAELALRDWLIGNGYLEPAHELDEESETQGEA